MKCKEMKENTNLLQKFLKKTLILQIGVKAERQKG